MPVEISSRLVKHQGKGVLLNIVRDITVRKQLEDEREQLISELNAYAHSVAHDLKNPVAILMGYSDILREDFGSLSDEDMRKYLGTIHTTAVKMQTIIDELLLLASVRSQGQVPFDKLDLGAIAGEALSRLENRIAESGAEITPANQWPEALGHAPWVEEVWMNYLSNALKYGGDPPVIALGAERQDDGQVRCWVRDNGQGIAPDDQAQLFGQFTRLDQARAEGHGLGLSIVQRIVERLGGTVGVKSEVGKGSTFTFTLQGV
jgi:signal transduction histidine kinase